MGGELFWTFNFKKWGSAQNPNSIMLCFWGMKLYSKHGQDDDSSEEQLDSEAVTVSKKAVPRLEGYDEMTTEFDDIAIPGKQHVA